MKLWAGRFTKETDDRVNTFNSSISFDCRMYKHDIKGSMAHAKMLGKCGIIPMEDVDAILKGLEGILKDIENGVLTFDNDAEELVTLVKDFILQEAETTRLLLM